jgi:hypothetical protein
MAKVDPNSLTAGISGSIGGLTIVRKRNGSIYFRRKSTKKPKRTPAREKQQTRLGRASVYASAALADPAKKAVYEAAAKGTGRSAQNLAVGDHMHPPVVEDIELSGYTGKKGETIRISARDDLAVATLRVTVRDRSGTVLEEGAAGQTRAGLTWLYVAQNDLPGDQIVQIQATAMDHAGNKSAKTVPHLVEESRGVVQ